MIIFFIHDNCDVLMFIIITLAQTLFAYTLTYMQSVIYMYEHFILATKYYLFLCPPDW